MADAQIVVGDIPAQQHGFQPRPALLTRFNRTSQGPPVVVLTGARGVGKTQLAAAYARARAAGGWRLIAWVNARDSENLLAGMAAVAEAAGLSDAGPWQGTADAGHAVRHWLEADGRRCLLVFDDARDPGLLRPFLPAAGGARVLITVAREPVAELGTSVPVDVFSAEEALALLNGRTGLADGAGAAAVAAELAYLPLALDQAAAVIARQHLGYAAYLAKLRALPVEDYLVRGNDGKEQPYPPGAAEAVLVSLEAARAADPVGVCAGVMEVMAVLSPAAVRRDLLRAAGQAGILLGGGRRVAASMVDQALERLSERSLLGFSLDGQAVSVHCLVAQVVRGGLARRGRLATACRAAASALEVSAEALAKPRDHVVVRKMLGQVTALLENAGACAGDADEKLARILIRLRFLALNYVIELGDRMPHAIAIGESLTADLERLLGPSHPDTLNVRSSLAAAYRAEGRVAEAIPLLEHTLVAQERVLGPRHPDTLKSQDNLAATYRDAGRFAEAILLFKLTLAAREGLLGAGHPSTVDSRGNLVAAYLAAGRVSEAIPLLGPTSAGQEPVLEADDLDVQAARDIPAAVQHETHGAGETPPPAEPPPIVAQEQPADEPSPSPDPVSEPLADAVSEPLAAPAAESPAAVQSEEPPEPAVAEEPPAVAGQADSDDDLLPEPAHAPEPEPAVPDDVPEPEPPVGVDPSPGDRPARRWTRAGRLSAVILILLLAGSAAFALSRPHSTRSSGHGAGTADRSTAGQPRHTAAQLAAAWVAQQVARGAIVACDPPMCSELEALGVPAANLLILRAGTTSPLPAQVIVVTPVVRSQFGSRLDSVYAPSVIAGFGSAPDQVSVQVIAKNGPAAYLTALHQDVAARKAAGTQLLANKGIKASAEALAQLAAGAVDSRLLIMLPALAAVHPIQILAFGHPAPDAGPDVPLYSADLSGSGRAAAMTDASYLSWLTSFVRAQLSPFAGGMAVLQKADQPVVRVVFAQPSPLGLLAHT